MSKSSRTPPPGFTLIEVLVALALFALASGILVTSALNAVRATEAVRSDSDQEQLFRFMLRSIIAIEDREELEDGGDWKLPDESQADWEAEVEDTEMVDLFKVTIQVNLDRGNFGASDDDVSRSYEVFLYRPDWESVDGNRDNLLEDRRQNLEDRRGNF